MGKVEVKTGDTCWLVTTVRLWWVDLAVFQVPTKAALSFPLLSWTGERKYNERLVGRDKDSLIKQKQRSCVKAKKNKIFYSLLPISRSCPATSWEAGLQYA